MISIAFRRFAGFLICASMDTRPSYFAFFSAPKIVAKSSSSPGGMRLAYASGVTRTISQGAIRPISNWP